MTLGNVYDMDLKKNETLIKEVIIQAQGEVSHLCYSSIFFIYSKCVDGPRGVHKASQGNLDQLYLRSSQLPE
jgi:hypothetical protein